MTPEREMAEILLVEDSVADARLLEEAFKATRIQARLNIVPDGEEALVYLRRGVKYGEAPRPDLILLDLNLPKVSGLEVLAAVKAIEELKSIPVIVLTSSSMAEDILGAYRLQASCYLGKPMGFDGFVELVKSIESFWLSKVWLPPKTT